MSVRSMSLSVGEVPLIFVERERKKKSETEWVMCICLSLSAVNVVFATTSTTVLSSIRLLSSLYASGVVFVKIRQVV